MGSSAEGSEIKAKVLKFEGFINDVLKEDLKKNHIQWELKTNEMSEWIQLKMIIQIMQEKKMKSFKGKMDIGANIYAHVHVPDTSKILINIGANIFAEFTLDEALLLIESRTNLLTKQLEIINNNSCDVKARIKLVLHGIQELENIK